MIEVNIRNRINDKEVKIRTSINDKEVNSNSY